MYIVGVDEAGRGPVMGPMVMVGLKCTEEDNVRLRRIGVKDSKLLTPLQRETMYDQLVENFEFEMLVLSPKEVDDALMDPELNLNWLEAVATAKILNILDPDISYVDCPSNNIEAYSSYLKKRMTTKSKLVCEHGADKTYPAASAASIIAKVTRDRAMVEVAKKLGQPVGSGYPSDPKTIKFLRENWDKHPEVFRQSWASYKKVAQSKSQKGLGDF